MSNNFDFNLLPLILVSALFIGTFILNVLNNSKFFKLHKYVFIFTAFLLVIISFNMSYVIFHRNTSLLFLFYKDQERGLSLYVDALSMFLVLIMSVLYFIFALFKFKNLNRPNKKCFSMITVFVSGLIGFLVSNDLCVLYIFSELMVLAQVFLLKYDEEKLIEDNFNYFIFQSICSLFIILGTMIFFIHSQSFNIGEIASMIVKDRSPLVISGLAFLLSGYGAKLLFIPFHNILSKLQNNSQFNSSPITVIGTFIAGIYMMIRISFTLFDGNEFRLGWVFILWGIIIVIIGATKALSENGLTKLITYISISEGGYFIMGIGITRIGSSTQGVYGALYQILNMALFIPLLYFCGEVIKKMTGTDDLDKMEDFRYKNPLFFICFIIGIFSAMGIPIFNGFVSKWILYKEILISRFIPIVVISALSILLIFVSLIKVLYAILMVKRTRVQETEKVDVSLSEKIPILFMALMCILTGLFPKFIIDNLLNSVVSSIYDNQNYLQRPNAGNEKYLLENQITPLYWFLVLVLIGVIIYFAFIIIKFFTGRDIKNKFHEEAVYDLNDEVDGFTSSELVWSLNNNFEKYLRIFKKFKTESLNSDILVLLCIFASLVIYMLVYIKVGG